MQVKFPQYLSSPLQVLFLEQDDIVLLCVTLLFLVLNSSVKMILLMIGVQVLYYKLKQKHSRGFLLHALYIVGIVRIPGYPISFMRTFNE